MLYEAVEIHCVEERYPYLSLNQSAHDLGKFIFAMDFSQPANVYIYTYIYLCIYICMSISTSVSLSLFISVFTCIALSLYIYIYMLKQSLSSDFGYFAPFYLLATCLGGRAAHGGLPGSSRLTWGEAQASSAGGQWLTAAPFPKATCMVHTLALIATISKLWGPCIYIYIP